MFAFVLAFAGCGSSQLFVAVPPGLQRDSVVHDTVDVRAQRYAFTPDEIHVKAGTLVTLRLRALDATHGFSLGAFGIDQRLEEGDTTWVEFYAPQKGEYDFKCSHFCGLGHLGMNGKIVVE